VPKYLVKFVEGQIYAQYPNAEIRIVEDYIDKEIPGTNPEEYKPYVSTGEVELAKGYIFPIKTFRDFEVDPLAAITSALSGVGEGEQVMIQILTRPVANYWQEVANEYIEAVREGKDPTATGGFWKSVLKGAGSIVVGALDVLLGAGGEDDGPSQKPTVRLLPNQEEELRQISEKMTKVGFEMGIRIVAKAPSPERSEGLLRDAVASFKQFTTANLNSFVHSPVEKTGAEMYSEYKLRYLSGETPDIVNIEELASIYHLPNVSVETPNISWCRAKKAEPPMNLPINEGTIFAETDFRGQKMPFGIQDADRRLHYYLLGKTGTGKSTVFKNMIISDILAGKGVGVVDPHGELVESILDFIPSNRINDVIYLDPADVEYPVGFNLLELDNMDQRDLVADGVVEVFKKHFEYSWGPRLQYVLTNAILTALEAQGTTILAVQRMLIDNNFRKFIVKQVKDPLLKNFWEEEFANMARNSRLVTEAVAPIQNKVGRFLSSSTIRNIVGQVSSTINLREIMDTGKIFLVNLSQGRLGEESSALLGGMIVTRLQSTAMERVDMPEDERRDFFLYVDEFQNYATDSFAKILSEARKYRLCLHLTHQYIDQLPENVRRAIFGNVGTLSTFVVGPTDADILAKEFSPTFDEEDLVALERHSMYLKMSINGMISKPFSARSLDLRYEKGDNKSKVVRVSRERYGRPREEVEDKIERWANQGYSDKGNRSHTPNKNSKKGDN
jgi:type IV secretory pathway TraG/TraD family ATPase VirD4